MLFLLCISIADHTKHDTGVSELSVRHHSYSRCIA